MTTRGPRENADTAAPATDHRKRPRRRGDALFAAIFQATLDELAESGFAGLTMERVAERAHASKASLYRRWPGKVELVMDSIYHLLPEPEDVPDTGSLRGDLLAMLRRNSELMEGPAGQAMRGLISEVVRETAPAARVRAYARGTTIRSMRLVVDRADARGELRADTVTERQLETGPALVRYFYLSHGGPAPEEVLTEIVDEVLLPVLRSAGSGAS